MVNLQIEMIMYLMANAESVSAGRGIRMSEFRKRYYIPSSTFHRHMRNLLDKGIVRRVKRDHYKLSLAFSGRLRDIYNAEINSDNIPF